MRLLSMLLIITVFACSPNPSNQAQTLSPPSESGSYTIAFGSCNHQNKPQPLWKDIAAEHPDLWIWLGDNIYGDTENMETMAGKYQKQKSNKAYQAFTAQVPVIGTWDDHDYGVNDGDNTYPKKSESRDLALEFLGVQQDAEVRTREGLYQSYVYTYEGLTIRVILLDARYFKTPILKGPKGYTPNETAELLGEAQWQWLEQELQKKEDILIIGNGTQVIPQDHKYEKWANYPANRKRLFSLLAREQAAKVLLLSGDRHIGEISKINLGERVVYEVTSSGLTHSYSKIGNEYNRYRVGKVMPYLNYGLVRIKPDKTLVLMLCGKDRKRHLEVVF